MEVSHPNWTTMFSKSISWTGLSSHHSQVCFVTFSGLTRVTTGNNKKLLGKIIECDSVRTSLGLSRWKSFWLRIITWVLFVRIRFRLMGIRCTDGVVIKSFPLVLRCFQRLIIAGRMGIKALLLLLVVRVSSGLSNIKMWIILTTCREILICLSGLFPIFLIKQWKFLTLLIKERLRLTELAGKSLLRMISTKCLRMNSNNDSAVKKQWWNWKNGN